MKLSVIVSTYNQPVWLGKVLHGYLLQTFRDFELLIADDGSDRRTSDVIEAFRRLADFPVRHVWHEDRDFRKCAILNLATLQAEADYLVFTDGDCIPRKDYLATHDRLAAPGCFLSGGYCKLPMDLSMAITEDDIASGRAFSLRWLRQHGLTRLSPALKIGPGPKLASLLDVLSPTKASWNGHNASTWKKHIFAVNGHNEEMRYGGEDRELGERLLNSGLTAKRVRHRALLLHLDHQRGYVTPESLGRNRAIRDETVVTRRVWCPDGILKRPQP